MSTTSQLSTPIAFINVSKTVKTFSSKFFYNFYVVDETISEDPEVPEVYKKSTIVKNAPNISNSSTRIPRYIELTWTTDAPSAQNSTNNVQNKSIKENINKVFTQNDVTNFKYLPYGFSSDGAFVSAIEDVNKNIEGLPLSESGLSQTTILENFISDLIKGYEELPEKTNIEKLREEIKNSIASIEKFIDAQESVSGYKFFDKDDKKIKNNLAKLLEKNIKIYSQIDKYYIADIFDAMQLPDNVVAQLNSSKTQAKIEQFDIELKPIASNGATNQQIFEAKTETIGCIIDRYEFTNNEYSKDKTIFIEDANTQSFVDINVKYGATYLYALRIVTKIIMPTVQEANDEVEDFTYYCAGRPTTTTVECIEESPPPHPVELDFTWDYKNNQFFVKWQMPFNFQRDIKQFQIFRRKSINEPFELLEQQCFDFSTTKAVTGEVIDGNNIDMTKENLSYVKYIKIPTYDYLDSDFRIDSETLTSSKYIYTLASIDAHGLISNYSAQYEVFFDFFKNKLIKRMISEPGAPRQYPNLMLKVDLFKDIIQVSGMSSQKLKIYFMPEYFKITCNQDNSLKKIVCTKQDGEQAYYKLQFINVQNQKSDSLKIIIDDPNGFTR